MEIYHTNLFQKLFNTKHLEDKFTGELLENVSVDELYDDRVVKTVPCLTTNTL